MNNYVFSSLNANLNGFHINSEITINANASKVINVESGVVAEINVNSAAANDVCAKYWITANSAGIVYYTKIGGSTSYSLTWSTANKLTIQNNLGSSIRLYILCFKGNVY